MSLLRKKRLRLALVPLAASAAIAVPLIVTSSAPARTVKQITFKLSCRANYAPSTNCNGSWSLSRGFSDSGSARLRGIGSPFSGLGGTLSGHKGKFTFSTSSYPTFAKKGCNFGGRFYFTGSTRSYRGYRTSGSPGQTCGVISTSGGSGKLSLTVKMTIVKP